MAKGFQLSKVGGISHRSFGNFREKGQNAICVTALFHTVKEKTFDFFGIFEILEKRCLHFSFTA